MTKLEIVEDNTQLAAGAIDDAVLRALEEIGIVMEGHAKELSPVDTGRLRNSITHVVDTGAKSVAVGSAVPYAIYQELGTSKMPAANNGRGFLRPAMSDHAAEYRAIIEKHLGNA